MRSFLILLLLVLVCGVWAGEFQPLDQDDILQLLDMLAEADLDSTDLAFEKDWDLSTRFKLESQMRVLQNPWEGLNELAHWRRLLGTQCMCQIASSCMAEAWQIPKDDIPHTDFAKVLENAGTSPKALAKSWSRILDQHQRDWRQAFSAFSPAQIDSLRSFWYQLCSESEDREKYKDYMAVRGLPYLEDVGLEYFAEFYDRVDWVLLRQTALSYQKACSALEKAASKLKFPSKKPYIYKSPHGLMIFGTAGDDIYLPHEKERVCLILDPSGNDQYRLPLGACWESPFFYLWDGDGNDVYSHDQPGGLFTAELGCCISVDVKGRDLYQGDDFSFAAYLGFALHRDLEGDDIYRCGMFSQGAALFGVAILNDEAGNDRYDATSLSQGLGTTRGIGLLMDKAGDDIYYLGGKYYHAPLMPLDHRTLGQGMGFGFRPDYAGGIGILYDGDGNDRYLGGVYAQGVGYWYAMGMLIDEAGNDVYNAVYYPQGSGIHLACGMLYDASGDDAYYSRNGPGQGAAHDWGVGMLIDGAGNDAYSIHGGQGLGLSNSVAIFVDRSGDDRYERKEEQNYGSGARSRGAGSIGLFLDAGGTDSYPDSLMANDKTWQKGTYGIGRDIDLRPSLKTSTEELAESAELPEADDPIEELFAAAAEWEVGSAIQRVRTARSYLAERSEEAIPWVLEHKLNTKSGLEYRALEALLKDAPQMAEGLYPYINEADSLAAKNAISLLAGEADSLLVPYIQELLTDGKYIPTCLSVLGVYPNEESIATLSQWLVHPVERYQFIAARSLASMQTPETNRILREKLVDPSFLLKCVLRFLTDEDER
ncbi:MAG: HEAT repeat domain-containing protein [Candidatus Cloacimonetes bacterium]|nr:HEAT repeat domain-containing protein [Candidatus Cloacimonadota bacterium]